MGIKDYSTTAASNTSLFPEDMNPASVNNSARQVQADMREWYETPQWRDLGDSVTYSSGTGFTISGDVTGSYIVDQRIRATGSGAMGTIYGTITGSSYSSPNTTVTVSWDSGSMDATLTGVAVGIDPTNDPVPFEAFKLADGDIAGTKIDIAGATSATVASADKILFADADDSDNIKRTTAQDIAALADITAGNVDSESAADGYVLTADGSSGAAWEAVPSAPVTSVAGKTGVVTLAKGDVGLGNVPNTDVTDASNISSGTLPGARLDNTAGAIGTYMMADGSTGASLGSTIAGTSLDPAAASGANSSTAVSGTWRCMGYSQGGGTPEDRVTLWMRIS